MNPIDAAAIAECGFEIWHDPPELERLWVKFDVPRQGLERLRRLLALMDNPQKNLQRTIHIAGTNGKGSVSAFCRSTLIAAGHKPHSFTSPHLISVTERLRISDVPIDSDRLLLLLDQCTTDDAPVSYFECLTAAFFVAAAQFPSDWSVLECGLGGRLDATNLIECPDVAVITPIGLDHEAFLGDTIEKIAYEKAGIIKPDGCVVSGPQTAEAESVIIQVAQDRGARLVMCGRDWQVDIAAGRHGVLTDDLGSFELPEPSLVGRHQIDNAALAAVALRSAQDANGQRLIADDAIYQGIKTARWRGRMESLASGPWRDKWPKCWNIWVDGAHNALGMKVVADFVEQRRDKCWVAAITVLKTKNLDAILSVASETFDSVYCFGGGELFHDTPSLSAAAARAGNNVRCVGSSLDGAMADVANDFAAQSINVMLVGSLHLVGDVLRRNGVTPYNMFDEPQQTQ